MPQRRTFTIALCLLLVLFAATAAPARPGERTGYPGGGRWEPGDAQFGVHAVRNVAFAMSDGVTLYGDVSYPADPSSGRRAPGRFPVLLAVTPYDFGGASTVGDATNAAGASDYYVGHGYIAVTVDARGTGRSGGIDEFLSPRAQRDGAELIQHVAHELDGSSGEVGLVGCSYLGEWALFNAANADAAGRSPVKAAVPQCASGVFFREFLNVGGMMTTDWYAVEALFAAADASPLSPQPATTITNVPDHLQGLYRHFVTSSTNTLLGGDRGYEGSWWRQRSPLYRARDIVRNGIPTLLMSSYDDIFPAGALELFTALQNLDSGRSAFAPLAQRTPSPRYQIVMGPGAHASGISQEITLQWFDTWIKGEDTGLDRTTRPIHVWRRGADAWFDTDRYPVAAEYRALHLAADGVLAPSPPTDHDGADALRWAPDDAGGSLRYDTAPLAQDTLLAGPSAATLYITSNRPDVQLIATLSAVAPDGTVRRLGKFGALIGSQRATDPARDWVDASGRMVRPYHPFQEGSESPVPVGEVVRYDIELPPVVEDVPAGHRIRLALRTQDFVAETAVGPSPGLVPNVRQLADLVGGSYEVQRRAGAASAINLPLLPARTRLLTPSDGSWDPTGG